MGEIHTHTHTHTHTHPTSCLTVDQGMGVEHDGGGYIFSRALRESLLEQGLFEKLG